MLKKTAAGFIAAAAVMLGSVCVYAADTAGISAGSTSAAAGKEFSVYISLTDVPTSGVNAVDLAVSYDKSVVTIKSAEPCGKARAKSDSADKEMFSYKTNPSAGNLNICWATYGGSGYAVKSPGNIFKVTGTVNANAAVGSVSEINIIPVDRKAFSGASGKNTAVNISGDGGLYTASVTSGTITVKAGGDVNKDGRVDETDASLVLKRILTDNAAAGFDELADVCAPFGKVDMTDVIWILNNMSPKGTALDLSKTGIAQGSYNSAAGTLTMKNISQFTLALPRAVAAGEKVKVYAKMTDNGGTGCRSWLSDSATDSCSAHNDMFTVTNGKTEEYILTADKAADRLLFKGPTYDSNMGDITFEYVGIEYVSGS